MNAFTAGTVFGVLLNETATVDRLAGSFREPPYKAPPAAPVLYIKPRNTLAGEGAVVAVPREPGAVRVDATVGAVIGRRVCRLAAAEALGSVKGYVVVSDLTLPHDSYYRPAVRLRCRDGFCPMSEPGGAVDFDLSQATLTIRIDGVQVHARSFDRLVRDLPHLIEAISSFITLEENDVVLIGPPDDAPLGRAGSAVSIEVPGLRTLTHTLVHEGAS